MISLKRNNHFICFGFICLIAASIAGLFSGCSSSRDNRATSEPISALIIPADDYDSAWDEIVEVLREHYFIPDRQDRRTGIIVTLPSVSKQWFEFWRDDAIGFYQIAESSLHTIRRIVEVRFTPKGKNSIEIKIKVTVQRKNQPQRQATTASGAIQAFRENVPTYSGKAMKTSQMAEWTDLGEDIKLEQYLLTQIYKRLQEAKPVYQN